MEKKRLILIGKGGSGKDYARKISENIIGAKYAVSYTSRPPREGEVEGEDYFFVDESFFTEGMKNNFWYEYVVFNGWYYGTSNEQFQNDKLFIMTPKGLSHLSEEDRNESAVLYLNMPEEVRKERMLARNGNADSVERRLEADELDFENFEDWDFMMDNPFYRVDEIIEVWRRLSSKAIIIRETI